MKFTFCVAFLILSASLVSSQHHLTTTIRQIRPRCGTCNPTCFRRRSNADSACAPTNSCRLVLNCSVRRCVRPNDSQTPFGFQCTGTIPPPTTLPPVTLLPVMTTPNTCPNICTLDVDLVVSQCSQPRNQAVGCTIQECTLAGSQGLACAQPTVVTSSTMGGASSAAPTTSVSPSISSTPSATASVTAAASISATVTPSPSASPSISISPSPSQSCELTAQGSAGTNIVCRCGSDSSSVIIPLGSLAPSPSPIPAPAPNPLPPCVPPPPVPTIPACYNNCLTSGLGLLCRPSAFGGFSSSARGAADGCCTQCSGSLSGPLCIFS